MIQQTFARPRRRAIFVGAAACLYLGSALHARPLPAQFRLAWDVNAAITQFDGRRLSNDITDYPAAPATGADSRWLGQRAMGGAVRYSHPFLQLSADAVVRDGDVSSRATGGMSALLASPSWNGFRVSATYDRRHVPNDGVKSFKYDPYLLASWAPPPNNAPSWQSTASANISYARNSTGVWLRANRYQGFNTSDSISNWSVTSGVTQQLRNFVVGVVLGARNRNTSVRWHSGGQYVTIDSLSPNPTIPGKLDTTKISKLVGGDSGITNAWQRWSEATGIVAWGQGRFSLDASVSARPGLSGYPAAMWGEVSAAAAITSRIAVVANTRRTPVLPGVAYSSQRIASLGLRIAPAAFWRPAPLVPIRSSSRGFRVDANGAGQYTITLIVPNARSVELAGDFTSWKAVKLRQIDATRWEIALPVAPGSHRCNIRIDGADWVPPPGVPSIADEFNGRVGLFVAE